VVCVCVCVSEYDGETSIMQRPWPIGGLSRHGGGGWSLSYHTHYCANGKESKDNSDEERVFMWSYEKSWCLAVTRACALAHH